MSAIEHASPLNSGETQQERDQHLRSRSLELLTDPEQLAKFINSCRNLTDEEFEEELHGIGFRIAAWEQRRGALKGDISLVKACEVYLDRVDSWRARKRKPVPKEDPAVKGEAFLQQERKAGTSTNSGEK